MAKSSKSFSARLLTPILTPLATLLAKKVSTSTFTKATGHKPPSKKNPGSYSDNLLWAIALTTFIAFAQMLVQKFLEKEKS
ncbi:MAG: DUF4235 domain-containing protein [Candidatus Nanopelagicales bacterium]